MLNHQRTLYSVTTSHALLALTTSVTEALHVVHQDLLRVSAILGSPVHSAITGSAAERVAAQVARTIQSHPAPAALRLAAMHTVAATTTTAYREGEDTEAVVRDHPLLLSLDSLEPHLLHPQCALYTTRWDRDWSGPVDDPYLPVTAPTITYALATAGQGRTRRFTFAHILHRMGFGRVDIHTLRSFCVGSGHPP